MLGALISPRARAIPAPPPPRLFELDHATSSRAGISRRISFASSPAEIPIRVCRVFPLPAAGSRGHVPNGCHHGHGGQRPRPGPGWPLASELRQPAGDAERLQHTQYPGASPSVRAACHMTCGHIPPSQANTKLMLATWFLRSVPHAVVQRHPGDQHSYGAESHAHPGVER